MNIIHKTVSALAYIITALALCAFILFIAIQSFALADKIREGCKTERASETMNIVTCKSGTHYETR